MSMISNIVNVDVFQLMAAMNIANVLFKSQRITRSYRSMMMNYKFFCNKDCEYYPCHKGLSEINCLFCFCPLCRVENCGGNFTFLDNGIKDCSNCVYPHVQANYDKIIERLKQ